MTIQIPEVVVVAREADPVSSTVGGSIVAYTIKRKKKEKTRSPPCEFGSRYNYGFSIFLYYPRIIPTSRHIDDPSRELEHLHISARARERVNATQSQLNQSGSITGREQMTI